MTLLLGRCWVALATALLLASPSDAHPTSTRRKVVAAVNTQELHVLYGVDLTGQELALAGGNVRIAMQRNFARNVAILKNQQPFTAVSCETKTLTHVNSQLSAVIFCRYPLPNDALQVETLVASDVDLMPRVETKDRSVSIHLEPRKAAQKSASLLLEIGSWHRITNS